MGNIFFVGKTSFFRAKNFNVSTKTLWSVLCLLLLFCLPYVHVEFLDYLTTYPPSSCPSNYWMTPHTYAIGRNTKYIPIPNRILKNKKVAHSRQNVPVCLAELLFERFSAKSVWVGAYKCSHFLTASACDIEVLQVVGFKALFSRKSININECS